MTPYYYSSYDNEDEVVVTPKKASCAWAPPHTDSQGIEIIIAPTLGTTAQGHGDESIIINSNLNVRRF